MCERERQSYNEVCSVLFSCYEMMVLCHLYMLLLQECTNLQPTDNYILLLLQIPIVYLAEPCACLVHLISTDRWRERND